MGYTLPNRFLQASAKNGTLAAAGSPISLTTTTPGASVKYMATAFRRRSPKRCSIEERSATISIARSAMAGPAPGTGSSRNIGLVAVANFHDERLRIMPDGQIFSTVTNGKNTMGAYGPQIAVEDRWAIVAYIRALQRSQSARFADLPEPKQQELQQQKKP